jgi:hypothetical protein
MAAHRILVIANETVAENDLLELIESRAEVLVVAPALAGRLEFWTTDDRRSRRRAAVRLESCLTSLEASGRAASGWVGDPDPLLAIADALSSFDADEIVVAAQPERRSNWLARNIAARARSRFARPVHQVVAA